MSPAVRMLHNVQLVVFLAVALVAAKRWYTRRGAARAWLAATFGLLGGIVAIGQLVGETPAGTVDLALVRVIIVALLLFPYFLYRFMATFETPPRWLDRTAHVLVAAVLGGLALIRHIPTENEPRSAAFGAYTVLVLAEWLFLSGAVTVRLWRAGQGQPTVARRRMRLLGSGAAAIALAIVAIAVAPRSDAEVTAWQVGVQALGLVSAVLFLGGFAPPRALLRVWRARDIEALQGAFVSLAQATSPEEVVRDLLPRLTRTVGAEGAAIYRADGELLGRVGRTDGAGGEGVEIAPGVTQYGTGRLGLAVPGGRLELWTSAYTPYFGREEVDLVRNLGALLHVTLERTYAHAREVAAREALDEAQRIAHLGSWRLDLRTGAMEWSDEMYRLLGLEPQSVPLHRGDINDRMHPDDVEMSQRSVADAIATGGDFTNEVRVINLDGSIRCLFTRGSALKDEHGEVVALLGTCQDVTEAHRLDRMRREFVANAAHELRTPLTTVSGMASLLASRRDRLTAPELDDAFEALGRQGERARRLVTSLLDLSRLEADRMPVQLAPVDVRRVVEQALETAPPPEAVRVAVDVPEGLKVTAEEGRLQEILVNLLGNAYRYGGPTVTVRAVPAAGGVEIGVSDDGPGIAADFVGELFQPFSRAAAATGKPGSGLGLAISHRLAGALGGELSYEPAQPRGARFTVRLRAAL